MRSEGSFGGDLWCRRWDCSRFDDVALLVLVGGCGDVMVGRLLALEEALAMPLER